MSYNNDLQLLDVKKNVYYTLYRMILKKCELSYSYILIIITTLVNLS